MEKRYYAYLLRCSDGTIYCGSTDDIPRRLQAHNSGAGAKYTRSRRPVELIYREAFATRGEALSREAALKKLSHKEKLLLAQSLSREDVAPRERESAPPSGE